MRSDYKKHNLKSGLTKLFTAGAFALFSAVPLASAQGMGAVDLVQRFGDIATGQDPQQRLAHELISEGYEIVGMGMVMGARGPMANIAVFANDKNEWRMLSFDTSFQNARLITQGTSFSVINYRYNVRVNYDGDYTGGPANAGAALIPVQAQGGNSSCMDAHVFGRTLLKEKFATGYLMQGYDQSGEIMKLYVSDEGSFLGASVKQDHMRTTCGQFQGDGFKIATGWLPVTTAQP